MGIQHYVGPEHAQADSLNNIIFAQKGLVLFHQLSMILKIDDFFAQIIPVSVFNSIKISLNIITKLTWLHNGKYR
jgi:hypothetical protein